MTACERTEALLAEQIIGVPGAPETAELEQHLVSCDACLELSRELAGSGVEDALLELGALSVSDFAELRLVDADNYVRGREIGRGGMGRIVRARDRRLGRQVAIKELLDDRLRDRFVREARLTARLQHPAIVNVHEAGRWPSGEPFYAMKYVAGKPLDQVIAERRTLEERLALLPNVITVVDAVAYAHSERIIHRDLKPQNVLVGAFGETVVIDWGIAKDLGATEADPLGGPYRDDGVSVAGAGTLAYMPPEQRDGGEVDERADVYALGATLRHVLAGRPGGKLDGVPIELRAIVAKATATDPAGRYPGAKELAEELRRYQAGKLVAAHPYTLVELSRRFVQKHRVPVLLSAASLLALAVVGVVGVTRVVEARRVAEAQRDATNHSLAELLVERGRQELVAGYPLRALAFLTEALSRGAEGPTTRTLLGEATRPADAVVAAFAEEGVGALALTDDGGTLFAGKEDGRVVRFDVATGKREDLPWRHATPVSTIALAGGLVLTADTDRSWDCDKTVRVGDVATGKMLAEIPHDQCIRSATFSRDGRRIATVTDDRAFVWDAHTGARVASIGHSTRFFRAVLSPDGSRLASAHRPEHALVWDVASGALLYRLDRKGSVAGLEFDAEGRRLALAHADGTATIVDAATGKQLWDLAGGPAGLRDVRFSPSGVWLAARSEDGTLRMWATDTGKPRPAFAAGAALFAWRWRDDRFVTAGRDFAVRSYSSDGFEIESFDYHHLRVRALVTGGDRIASAGEDGRLVVWETGRPRLTRIPGSALDVGFDREELYLIGADGVVERRGRDGRVLSANLVPHLPFLSGKLVRHWTKTKQLDGQREEPPGVRGGGTIIDTSEDGTSLVVTYGANRKAQVKNPDGRTIGEIDRSTHVGALSPDGRRAVLGDTFGKHAPVLWNVANNQTREVPFAGLLVDTRFSPTGDRVLGVGNAGELVVWDAQTGSRLFQTRTDVGGPLQAVWSGDGRAIVAYGGGLASWVPGQPVRTLYGHRGSVIEAAPDFSGERVFAVDEDGTAMIWDTRSGQVIRSLSSKGRVRSAAFDGARVAIATADAVWVWEIPSDDRSATALARLAAEVAPLELRGNSLLPRESMGTPLRSRSDARTDFAPECPYGTVEEGAPFPRAAMHRCRGSDENQVSSERIWWPSGIKLRDRRPDSETWWDFAGRPVRRRKGNTVTLFRATGFPELRKQDDDDGSFERWHPNGQRALTGAFERGWPVGLWTRHDVEGRRREQGRYLRYPVKPPFLLPDDDDEDRNVFVRIGTWTSWDENGVATTKLEAPCPSLDRYPHTKGCR